MSNLTETMGIQLLRGRILKMSLEAHPLGASMEVITAGLKREGYDINKQDVVVAILYLEGKGLVKIGKVENKALGISRQIANITPLGIDVLEGTKTVDGVELM